MVAEKLTVSKHGLGWQQLTVWWTVPQDGWSWQTRVCIDQADHRHGPADRGNVVPRHTTLSTPDQQVCTAFFAGHTTSGDWW